MQIDNEQLLTQFKLLANNFFIHLLVAGIVLDIFTGFLKGFKIKEARSDKGLFGILKHTAVFLLVVIVYPYAMLMNFHGFANAIVLFYILSYGISIVENLGQLGFPMPRWVSSRLYKLKEELDETVIGSEDEKNGDVHK